MEIIGTTKYEEEQKNKKIMLWMIISIAILFVISIVLLITIYFLKEQLFKFTVDSKKVSLPTEDLFVYDGESVYVSLKDIAPIIGYEYYKGGYKEYTEDTSKCYLQSNNEICTFENKENLIYKTPIGKLDYEYFNINTPIKEINNKLYIESEDLELACNLKFYYQPEKNAITIYTLPYYANFYTENNKYSAVSTNFKNQKALMYNLLVTQSRENTLDQNSYNNETIYYGISTLDNKEIVGKKYTSIEFIESTKEFIVKTTENKVGIITADGDTKVQPQYDSLKQIDKDLNLYLVTNNGKKGVIEKYGKILIYPEYDQIGIDATLFGGNTIKNPYLLFNYSIPVMQNGKWGLFDKKGNKILDLKYDGIGCSSNNNTANNIVIVPSIKMIVVAKDYQIGNYNQKVTYYGFVNYLGREIVQAGLEKVYSTVNNGRNEYKMDYNGQTFNIIEKIREIEPDLDLLNDETKANKTIEEIKANKSGTNNNTNN